MHTYLTVFVVDEIDENWHDVTEPNNVWIKNINSNILNILLIEKYILNVVQQKI